MSASTCWLLPGLPPLIHLGLDPTPKYPLSSRVVECGCVVKGPLKPRRAVMTDFENVAGATLLLLDGVGASLNSILIIPPLRVLLGAYQINSLLVDVGLRGIYEIVQPVPTQVRHV